MHLLSTVKVIELLTLNHHFKRMSHLNSSCITIGDKNILIRSERLKKEKKISVGSLIRGNEEPPGAERFSRKIVVMTLAPFNSSYLVVVFEDGLIVVRLTPSCLQIRIRLSLTQNKSDSPSSTID